MKAEIGKQSLEWHVGTREQGEEGKGKRGEEAEQGKSKRRKIKVSAAVAGHGSGGLL